MSSYPGINLTVEVYDANNNLVDNVTLMTDENNLVYTVRTFYMTAHIPLMHTMQMTAIILHQIMQQEHLH